MTESSPRFAFPYILPGQAQKEQFHNEALARVDALLHSAAEQGPVAAPPAGPQPGQIWIVAETGEGAWQGRGHALACWTEGGWRFASPVPGMLVWQKAAGHWLHWSGSDWSSHLPVGAIAVNGQQVVGARQPAVPNPSGGTIIDAEARSSVGALIVALRTHGLID